MRERILIVVVDPVERRLLDQMVRQFGYEPAVAASGEAALAALTGTNGTRIDAVVLDLVTPDLDGVGVLAKMCAAGLAVPVIVQTTDDGIDDVAAAMRAGATDFVVKPVGGERLRVALRNALAARALECELACVKRRARAQPESAENSPAADTDAPPLVPSIAAAAAAPPTGALALLDASGHMRALADIEAEAIRFAIGHYRGQMSEVARRLRIGRSTLYRKLDSLGLDAEISGAKAPALQSGDTF
jgi:DNA-binding NtrC family response regulator